MDQQSIHPKDSMQEAKVCREAPLGKTLVPQGLRESGSGSVGVQVSTGVVRPKSELSDSQSKVGGAFQKVTKLKQLGLGKSPQKENINLKNQSDLSYAALGLAGNTFRRNPSKQGLGNPSPKQSPIRNPNRMPTSPILGSSVYFNNCKNEVEMTKLARPIQMTKAVRTINDSDQNKNIKVGTDIDMKSRGQSLEASKVVGEISNRVALSDHVLNVARINIEENNTFKQTNGLNTIQKIIIRKDQDMNQINEVKGQIQDSAESKHAVKRNKEGQDSCKKEEQIQPNSGEFIMPQGILKTVQDDGDLVMRASPSKAIRVSRGSNHIRNELVNKSNEMSFQSQQHQYNLRSDLDSGKVLQKRGSSAMKTSPSKVKFKNLRDGEGVNRDLQQLVAMVTSQHLKGTHHQFRKVQIEDQNEKVMTPIVSPDIPQISRRFTSSNQQQIKNEGQVNEQGYRRDIAGYIRGTQEMNPQIFSNTPQRNLQNRLTGIGGSASNAYSLAHLSPLQQLPRLAVDKRISEKHMSQQSQESRNHTPQNQQFKQFLGKQIISPHDYEKISYGSPMRDGQIIEKPYVKNGIFDRMHHNQKNLMSHQKTQLFQSQRIDTPINQFNKRDLTPQKNNKFHMLNDFEGNERDSNPNYNDPGFSSNTTKKQHFQTTMRGGSVIRSNFKVNEHSVQKNQMSSGLYSKSRQTTSSKNDMGICKKLRFDNEVTPLSLGVNPRDPNNRKHVQMFKGTHPNSQQPGLNMVMPPPVHPIHPPQAYFDEKYLQGASAYPNFYLHAAPPPFSKVTNCRSPIVNPGMNPFQTPQSIFGFPQFFHQQHMPYYASGRYHNQFAGQAASWKNQSSKKKEKGRRRKEKEGREDARSEEDDEDSDEPMPVYPYIVHPIVNVGGKIPGQFMQIYPMGRHGAPLSPEKRTSSHKNKKQRHLTPNEKTSKVGVKQHDTFKSGQSDTPMDQEMAVYSANSSGIKANRKQVCNSSSKTIKLNKGNESQHKKHRGSDKSMITSSDIKYKQSPDRSINDSQSSSENSDDDEDSSGSSPQKGYRNNQRMQLLQQQQEANAMYFGENRIRLRMDDGFLTAMPPQQFNGAHQHHLMHQMFYPNIVGNTGKFDHHYQQQQYNSGNSRSGNNSSPVIKQKKGNNNDAQKGSKFPNENRQNRKNKIENSYGTQGVNSYNKSSNNNSNSSSTEKKAKIKSSLKKYRKRQRKMEQVQANKMLVNPYLNPFNPNYLANYNPLAQGMVYPPFFGADSPYNNFHLTYRPSYHYGNINILNGYNNMASSQNLHTSQPSYSFLNPTLCPAPSASASAASPSQLTPSPTHCPPSQVPQSHLSTAAAQQPAASGVKDSRRKRRTKQGKTDGKAVGGGAGVRQGLGTKRQQREMEMEVSDGEEDGVIQLRKVNQEEGVDGKGDEKLKSGQYNNNSRKNNNNYYGLGGDDRVGSNGKPMKRQKVSCLKKQEYSSKKKGDDFNCFKSPDEKQRLHGMQQSEPYGLFSQNKRSKDKSGRRDKNCFDLNLEQHQQLMLQNMQSFGPAIHNFDAEMVPQVSDGFGAGISSSQKKRYFNLNNQISQSPMQNSQNFDLMMGGGVGPLGGSGRMREFRLHPQQILDNSNHGHCSSYGQPFLSQSGQKKSKHSGEDFDFFKQKQASISAGLGHNNGNITGSNAQLNKLFSLSQLTSDEKIEVKKFNKDGAMDNLKDDEPGKRNDIDQIKILNSFQESGLVNGSDGHIALSLSHMKGRKQNGHHQSGHSKSYSFQNSNVKNYPASTSKNLEKNTIFNKGLLADQSKQMPAPTQGNRRPHGSSLKKVRSTNNRQLSTAGGGTSTNNAQSSLQTKRMTQEEKEQQNHQNEENIRQKTDQIINDTIRQDIEGAATQCKRCKCRNTKCLKLYCECLRNKSTCGPECHCMSQGGCHNRSTYMSERRKAVEDILKRNIDAFENKVDQDKNMHFKGCKCKASECQKKYCECFERGVPCTNLCKCVTCRNPFGNISGKEKKHHHHGHAENKCSEAQPNNQTQIVEVSMLEAPTNAIPSFDVVPQSERAVEKISQQQSNHVSPKSKGSKQQTQQVQQNQDNQMCDESAHQPGKSDNKDERQSQKQSQCKEHWESREIILKQTEEKLSEKDLENNKEQEVMAEVSLTKEFQEQQPEDQISVKKRIVQSEKKQKEKVKEIKQTPSIKDVVKNEQQIQNVNLSYQAQKEIKQATKPPLPTQKIQILKPQVTNPEEELLLAPAQKQSVEQTADQQLIKQVIAEEPKKKQVQKSVSSTISGLVKENLKQKNGQPKDNNSCFQDDNCENINTENVKTVKQQIKGPYIQQLKDSDSRKPKQIRKELALSNSMGTLVTSAQSNVIQIQQSSENKKKPEVIMEAVPKPQPTSVKKQMSLQSLDSAKRPLRSKRLSEKSTQKEAKIIGMQVSQSTKQTVSKHLSTPMVNPTSAQQETVPKQVPNNPITPFKMNNPPQKQASQPSMAPPDSSPLTSQAPKAPQLAPKKAQSSQSQGALNQNTAQKRQQKIQSVSHEKVQTRHQRKLLQKQQMSTDKGQSSGNK